MELIASTPLPSPGSARGLRRLRWGSAAAALFLLAPWSFGPRLAAQSGAKVIINEIHYHPADDLRDHEFIELRNFGVDAAALDGWELQGGVRFVFPGGTAIPAGGFLVVAADRARLAARYALAPEQIAGSYDGSLENAGERIELWAAEGYIVSLVEYGDSDPWPEAPDGLGPSLERISALREELDPAAWEPSIAIGGTPGAPNSTRRVEPTGSASTGLIADGAVWRFFRGRSEPPANWKDDAFDDAAWESGPAPIGYPGSLVETLLADMQASYTTFYMRRAFVVETPARVTSLSLLVSYDDGFIAYLNGVEVARRNAPGSSGSSVPHDGAATTFTADPIEQTLDISSFRNRLAAGQNVLAVHGLNLELGNRDCAIHPRLEARIDTGSGSAPPERPSRQVVINEVAAGGAGSGWVELFNSGASDADVSGWRLAAEPPSRGDRALASGTIVPAGGRVVIGEAALGFELDGLASLILATPDRRWIDALNPRSAPAGMSTGRFPDGDENRCVFPAPSPGASNRIDLESAVVINEIQFHPDGDNAGGEFIELHNRGAAPVDVGGWSFTRGISYRFPPGTVLAPGGFAVVARDPAAAQSEYGISGVFGPYAGRLRNDAETLLLRDALDNPRDRVRYADDGSWPEEADGLGPSVELVHPALENRFGPAWAASDGSGTPGAANSRRAADPAPIVVDIRHQPVIPGPSQPVRVLALVSDERPLVSVTLFYEVDGAGNPAQVPMVDDGAGDDGIVQNGVFGATIPARPASSIVAFWIRAVGAGNQTVTVPAGAPRPAFLYQVESGGEDGLRPTYRVIMRRDDLSEFQSRSPDSDELLDITLAADGRSFYNAGIRLRGDSARRCNPLSYRIEFSHDRDFHGIKRVNLNGCNADRQWLGLDLLRRSGVATPVTWFRQMAFNGQVSPDLRLRVEMVDEQFLERHFPGDDQGNLYRGVGRANLDYLGESFGAYRPDYPKASNEEADDYSDLIELVKGFDPEETPAAQFPEVIERLLDLDLWSMYFAVFAILGSTENGILLDNGDDYFIYHRPSDGRWVLLPWDLDSCFDEETQRLFRPTVDAVERVLESPLYAPDYWCRLEHLLAGPFDSAVENARIDHLAPLYSSARIQEQRSYVSQRRSYILARTVTSIDLAVDAGAQLCDDGLFVSQPAVSLRGLAPGCATSELRVNGRRAAYDPQTNAWTYSGDLGGGSELVVSSHYRDGFEVDRRSIPMASISQSEALPATVSSDRTLSAAGGPYRAGGMVTVAPGATLRIEAGARVLFDFDAGLVVRGALVAEGSAGSPIRLESDGCGESWKGIHFQAGSIGNRLTWCKLAGSGGLDGFGAALLVDGAVVSIDALDLATGAGAAIAVQNGGLLSLRNTTLAGVTRGVRVQGGDATLRSVRVIGSSAAAVEASSGSIDVEACVFWNCAAGIALSGGAGARISHSTFYGGGAGIEIGAASADADSLILWGASNPVAASPQADLAIEYSDVGGGAPAGAGNISADPLFVDAAAGDFRLGAGSPCRRSGRDRTDMGAIPFDGGGGIHHFLRCDSNGDGMGDVSDAVFTLLFLFGGGAAPPCAAAADCDASGSIALNDALYHLNFFFRNGPAPEPPYPACAAAAVEACAEATCAGS
jgi:hypothetical protein